MKKKIKTVTSLLLVAIDIGSSAIRMTLVEKQFNGTLHQLEMLEQDSNIGRDVFSSGRIESDTLSEAVEVLRHFKKVIEEYAPIKEVKAIVIASSAVREAENKDAFIERVFVATGFEVAIASNSDVNRLTYMGMISTLESHKILKQKELLSVEIGGGVTEFLGFNNGDVRFVKNSRLGLLRLSQQIPHNLQSLDKFKHFMTDQIDASLEVSKSMKFTSSRIKMLIMGGDARFAAQQLDPKWNETGLAKITYEQLRHLTDSLFELSSESIARHYKMTYFASETVPIALLAYCRIAERFNARTIYISKNSLRDGMIAQEIGHTYWDEKYAKQIRLSAIDIGKKYFFNERHANTVVNYSLALYDFLKRQHGLGAEHRTVLEVAGLLHDVGVFISPRNHHLHSKYLIENSDLFGLSDRQIKLVALIARYHRKDLSLQTDPEITSLSRDDRIILLKLASILRISDALDRSHITRLGAFLKFKITDHFLEIEFNKHVQDLSLENFSLEMKGSLFQDVFGLTPLLVKNT